MRALPARRIAFGALCAALLAATTGPAAMAADSLPEHDRAAASAALMTQVAHADAGKGELSPVVDLVKAVLDADGGQVPPDRVRKLGDAARAAVARAAADEDPTASVTVTTVTTTTTTTTTSSTSATPATTPALAAPSTGVLAPAADTTDPAGDALGAVQEALDALLGLLLPDDDTAATEETPAAATEDDLMARLDDLLDALLGADDADTTGTDAAGTDTAGTEVSTLPAPAEAASPAASTDPGLVPALTSLLVPGS